MSVVEVNAIPQNEVVIPVVPEEKIKKTRTRKVPVTEVKEEVPAPAEVIKRKTTEAQLRSIARARESKSAKCLELKAKQEEQRVEGLKKHQEALDKELAKIHEEHPNVPIKVVKPRGRPRKLVTVDENAISEPPHRMPSTPKPPKEPKAPKEPKPPKEPKAPKPPKPPKATKPPKAPKPSAPLAPRYQRRKPQYDTTTTDDSTDTESDSSEDSHKDRKYIRKAERRLDAVKRIDERLKSHGNHYFRNNLSIF